MSETAASIVFWVFVIPLIVSVLFWGAVDWWMFEMPAQPPDPPPGPLHAGSGCGPGVVQRRDVGEGRGTRTELSEEGV